MIDTTDITASGFAAPLDTATPPPGPHGLGTLRTVAGFARRPWTYPLDLVNRYGDIVAVPIPFGKAVVLGHPDHIKHVLLEHPERYGRSAMVAKELAPPDSRFDFFAFTPDNDEWRRGRRLLSPKFTQRSLVQLGDLFSEAINEEVDRWGQWADTGDTVDLAEPLKSLGLAVLFNAMFSTKIPPAVMPYALTAIRDGMAAGTARVAMFSFPKWIPRPLRKRGKRAEEMSDLVLDLILHYRRQNPTDTTDLLNVLLDATYDDGRPLEDEKIKMEMMGMVIGGHETTAAALAWTFGLLACNATARARVYAEVDALDGVPPTVGDLGRLPYVRACFDEAQRLQGGLVINPKTALVDDVIGGHRIDQGTTVLFSTLALQRDPRFWPQPERFNPDRFLNNEFDKDAYMPFGMGPRMCLGMRMAYIEAVLTIATAYQRYEFTVPAGWTPIHQYRMSMGLKGGLPVTISTRDDIKSEVAATPLRTTTTVQTPNAESAAGCGAQSAGDSSR